jgi:hypothetical protein
MTIHKIHPHGKDDEEETIRRATNKERLADLIYSLLRDSAPHLGIDLVRPPNPAHGDAVAVLFNDGRDVVITFAEKS